MEVMKVGLSYRALRTSPRYITIIIVIIRVFCPRAGRSGTSLHVHNPRLQSCRRQVFRRKLRNADCRIGAVASRCFPHPTLSLAPEQILKVPMGTNEEVKRVHLDNWALWTSPELTTVPSFFLPVHRSGNSNHPSPPIQSMGLEVLEICPQ